MQSACFNVTENTDPLVLWQKWFADASVAEPNDPDAAALATVGGDGMPNVRMVLVRTVDARGFAFFTNTHSIKGHELENTPKAALCFHWKLLLRQVRVQGFVERVSEAEADAYFAARHPVSRRGAHASLQSQSLDSRATLEKRVADITAHYPDDNDIPRPAHWLGYRIIPTRIEFWQQGDNRLHDRFVFTHDDGEWRVQRLYP